MDLNAYYGLETGEDVALVLNNEIKEEKGKLSEGRCYLDLDTVHEYLNDRFYADYNEGLLLYTTPDSIIRAEAGASREEGYIPAFLDNGIMYVALGLCKKFTNFSFTLFQDPNRAVLTTIWNEHQAAEIGSDTAVRYQGGVKSDILTGYETGDKVVILEEMEIGARWLLRMDFWDMWRING